MSGLECLCRAQRAYLADTRMRWSLEPSEAGLRTALLQLGREEVKVRGSLESFEVQSISPDSAAEFNLGLGLVPWIGLMFLNSVHQ